MTGPYFLNFFLKLTSSILAVIRAINNEIATVTSSISIYKLHFTTIQLLVITAVYKLASFLLAVADL